MKFVVQEAIRNAARQRGMDPLILFKRLAAECFLRRLSGSAHNSMFVLKGSHMFAVWAGDVVRAAVDLDLHCGTRTADAAQIIEALRRVADSDIPHHDYANFDLDHLKFQIFSPDSGQLVRVSFPVTFGKTKLDVRIDVSIGEPLTPGVEIVWYPSVLPQLHAFQLRCCTRETMISEKLALMVEFGADNTRIRDYYDIWFLITRFFFLPHNLLAAMQRTFGFREAGNLLLQDENYWLGAYRESFVTPLNEKHWVACVAQAHAYVPAPSFSDALGLIRSFVDPIFLALRDNLAFDGNWVPGKGWQFGWHHQVSRSAPPSQPSGMPPPPRSRGQSSALRATAWWRNRSLRVPLPLSDDPAFPSTPSANTRPDR